MGKRFVSLVLAIAIVCSMLAGIGLVANATWDGMGPKVIEGGRRDFIWPVPNNYNLRSCFYDQRNHCAIDIDASINTVVVASYLGTVIRAVDKGTDYYGVDGFGNYVVLQHSYTLPSGTITLYTRYSHLNSVSVSEGAIVQAGTEIGRVGSTGYSQGYHLDFQILYGNWEPYQTYSIDPYANELLELPNNIKVVDSLDCGPAYLRLVQELYCRPSEPVLDHAINGKKVTFTWQETANTTHYNLWIETKNAAGEWEYVEQIFYAESGVSREMAPGEYRAQLLSYNSNAYEPDGSDWVHTYADEVFFTIGADKKITYYDATGDIWQIEDCELGANYPLLDKYPTCSDGYFSGWAYTKNAQEWAIRPGETLEITEDVSLYPVYVSHSEAVSGNAVQIYNIDDFTQTGYDIEEVEVTVQRVESVGGWTEWSDYTTDAITPSDTVEVETTTLYKYYYFYCSNCGGREPFWGTSDCGASIPSTAWHIGWFTTPYSQCNHKTYSYTTAKYYTTSLGDGQIWNFSSGNLYDTAVGTMDSGGDTVVITTGYRSRTYVEQSETIEKTVTAYKITPKNKTQYEVLYYPAKTEYWVGEPVDLTCFALKATYEDGSTAIITDGFTVSGFETDTIGPKTMLISYDGFTVEFNVTVSYGGVCGDAVLWNLDYQGNLTIFGTGDMYELFDENPWEDYRGSIEKVVVQNGVTSISVSAFTMCKNLISVTLPNGLTKIGMSAFSDCTSLTSVSIPDSITCVEGWAFSGCDNLSYNIYGEGKYLGNSNNPYVVLVSITEKELSTYSIHPDTKIIGSAVFSNCANLTSITLPDGVTCIGDEAFSRCSTLTGITIPNSITSIGSFAFYGCSSLAYANIPDGVTVISGYAFSDCSSLTSIDLPEGITEIGVFAFIRCSGLTSIALPDSVTHINDWAFDGCTGLTNIIIPDGVTRIGCNAFAYCSGLTQIAIPNSVTMLDKQAFDGCDNLSKVIFCGTNEQWTVIEKGSNNDALTKAAVQFHGYENGACPICGYSESSKHLTFTLNDAGDGYTVSDCDETASGELVIPATYNGLLVTEIGLGAFRDCASLTSVTIPDSVTSIGASVFYGCADLTSIVIPDSITEISQWAFCGCINLTDVVLPNSLVSISHNAFKDCVNLNSFIIPDSVTNIGSSAFQGCVALSDVVIGSGVTRIGDYAFGECRGLTEIIIPEGVVYIGWDAFRNCVGLSSITIPASVTTIGFGGFGAFAGCTGLAELLVNEGNKTYHSDGNCIIQTATKSLIAGCKTSRIPSDGSVTVIGDDAFKGCTGLTNITIPDSVMGIGSYAFKGCTGLTSVAVGNGLRWINNYAFQGCTGLVNINIPKGVTNIEYSAFDGCNGLSVVTYCGAQEQWDAIKKGSCNEPLSNAKLQFHTMENSVCTICGHRVAGEMDGNDGVDHNDAIYLLLNVLFGDGAYPLNGADADIDGNGIVEQDDAVYLLLHALFGEVFYPLKQS